MFTLEILYVKISVLNLKRRIMDNVLKLNIKGYEAELPILPLPSGVKIAFFNLHGNSEMTEHCGKELAKY